MHTPASEPTPAGQGLKDVPETQVPETQVPGTLEAPSQLSTNSVFKVVELAARNSEASVMVFDASGVCGWLNPGTKRLLGVEDASALVGHLSLWQHCSVPGDPQGEALERAFRGEPVDLPVLDYHLQQLNSGAFSLAELRVSAKLLPLLNEDGGVMAVYVFNRTGGPDNGLQPPNDSQPPMEADPERLQLLRSIAGAKRFARKTAHDFNNHIAVMQGFASILQGRLQGDEQNRGLAEQIEASGAEALKLTGWLAGFANDFPMEQSQVDLNQVVKGVLAQCQREKPEGIELAAELAEPLPLLMGGREKLEQLCRILWQNAVEAMPQGGTLRWSTGLGRPADVGPGYGHEDPFIVLKVSDSGVGMDPETRSRMFDPFFTTKQGKLRGLDLTVAYEIVCAHLGSVEVTTGPDEGTSISVYLPAQLNPPDPQAKGQGSAEVQRSKQLLVVDDEELILQMLHEFLEGEGYDVTGVVSGEEALAICQDPNVNIDVVILDMSLPGITGQETFKHLMELRRGIKVIISTGNPHQQAVHDVMGQGAHGMLSKPFQLDHLAKVVKQLLS